MYIDIQILIQIEQTQRLQIDDTKLFFEQRYLHNNFQTYTTIFYKLTFLPLFVLLTFENLVTYNLQTPNFVLLLSSNTYTILEIHPNTIFKSSNTKVQTQTPRKPIRDRHRYRYLLVTMSLDYGSSSMLNPVFSLPPATLTFPYFHHDYHGLFMLVGIGLGFHLVWFDFSQNTISVLGVRSRLLGWKM